MRHQRFVEGLAAVLGVPDDLAYSSLRLTIGRFTTAREVDFAAARIVEVVGALRGDSA